MKNAQKVIFPQIATITQGTFLTFLTFLTDNLVYFQDYQGKRFKTARYLMQNIKFMSKTPYSHG